MHSSESSGDGFADSHSFVLLCFYLKEMKTMKKYLVVACILVLSVVVPAFTHLHNWQGRQECIDACKKEHETCLAKTPESNPQLEAARKEACHAQFKDCVSKCGQ